MSNSTTEKGTWWDALDEMPCNPHAGLLKTYFCMIRETSKPLTEQQQAQVMASLHALADGKDTPPKVAAMCANQLGNIYAGISSYIKVKKCN